MRRRAAAATAVLPLLLTVTGACGLPGVRVAQPASDPGVATVERVVDGDTLRVRLGGGSERLRLLGIDTPESVDPRRPVECLGKEAARFTASLLPVGTRVRVVRDVEPRDRFSRLLAYVYRLPDELFVNAELVRRGYAQVLTVPPNVAHAAELRAAAAEARAARRGLWGDACARQ